MLNIFVTELPLTYFQIFATNQIHYAGQVVALAVSGTRVSFIAIFF